MEQRITKGSHKSSPSPINSLSFYLGKFHFSFANYICEHSTNRYIYGTRMWFPIRSRWFLPGKVAGPTFRLCGLLAFFGGTHGLMSAEASFSMGAAVAQWFFRAGLASPRASHGSLFLPGSGRFPARPG